MDFFSETVQKLSLMGLASCDEDVYRALLVHMRWVIEDAFILLRFLQNEDQNGHLSTNEEVARAITIDDGVKIVMKSNLVDASECDDHGYRAFFKLLELYNGNWLAVLDFIKSVPSTSLVNTRRLSDVELKMYSASRHIDSHHSNHNTLIDVPQFETTLSPIQTRSYPTVDMAYEVLDKYARNVGFTVSKVNTTFRQQTDAQKAANEPKVIVRQYFNCTFHLVSYSAEGGCIVGSKRRHNQKDQNTNKSYCKFKCCAALTSTGVYAFRELRSHHNHPPQNLQAINITKKLSIEHHNLIRAYHAQGLTVQEIFSKLESHHHIEIGIRKIYRVIASTQKKVKVGNEIGIELTSIPDITDESAFPCENHFDSSDCDA